MTNFTEKQIRETISKETIEQKKDRLLKTQLIFEANLERVRAEQDSLGVRVIHKTKAGLVCVMCAGYYPLPTGYTHGFCFNRMKTWLPVEVQELFICWECSHSLLRDLQGQSDNEFYKAGFLK